MPKSVLTPQAENFPQWYQDVVAKGELADNGPVRGTMVIRPYGYAIWERMQRELDDRIKAAGAQNAYFPLFIPESYFSGRPSTSRGSAPSWRWSPTPAARSWTSPSSCGPPARRSSTSFFAKWVQSYRDLPLLINQWANVVRWELRPRLFLRTTEFLWQEGHTAHATRGGRQRSTPADPPGGLRGLRRNVPGHARCWSAARPSGSGSPARTRRTPSRG